MLPANQRLWTFPARAVLEQESIRLLIFSPFPLMDSWKLFLNEGLAWRFALPTSPFIDGAPGSYQRLDLFNRLLRVLCPNLTDASTKDTTLSRNCWTWVNVFIHEPKLSVFPAHPLLLYPVFLYGREESCLRMVHTRSCFSLSLGGARSNKEEVNHSFSYHSFSFSSSSI